MQKWFLSIASVFVLANLSFAQADAKAVIEKAIKAAGGKDKLAKYPAGITKFAGEMSVMGMNIDLEATLTAKPQKMKTEMTITVAGNKLDMVQLATTDTAKVRVRVMGMTVNQPLDDATTAEMKLSAEMMEMSNLLPLLDAKKYELKADKDAEVDGKKCDVVIATLISHKKEVKMYFDKESNLLAQTSYEGLLPGRQDGKKGTRETRYSEYKELDGIKHPMKFVAFADGQQYLSAKVSEHKNLEKIDDKEFTIDD